MSNPGDQPLNDDVKASEGAKLMKRLNSSEKCSMDFEEFSGWFRRTCWRIRLGERQVNEANSKSDCFAVCFHLVCDSVLLLFPLNV